ncbi:MAG: NifU family protein [Candidatus Sumerlaeota bacterium]|nr:NifU family protein [Candidatus Sumerlaeota bacterium]
MADTPTADVAIETAVKQEIERIRPLIQGDGGDIEFVGMHGKVVNVRLKGACAGCPGAKMTLKMGVERRLKAICPEVESVESV